jgi:hypothetical protein
VGQILAHVIHSIEEYQQRFSEAGVAMDADAMLAELANSYTMSDEREIHGGAGTVQHKDEEITFF